MRPEKRVQLPSPRLTDHLIVEILSWLPVKSLLRFRCVSKSLNSLISDPTFVKSHLQRSPKNANVVLVLGGTSPTINESVACALSCSKRSLLDNPSSAVSEESCHRFKGHYRAIGSCNGLVCFRKYVFVSITSRIYKVRLLNPATRLASKKLPSLCVSGPGQLAGLASPRFGFGYDHSSDTYKVFAVLPDSQNTTVKVLSLGDSCWREVLSVPAFSFVGYINGQYLSGTVNWLAVRDFRYGYEWGAVTIDELVIFSLDLATETYKLLLLPDCRDEVYYQASKLGVLRDCLCFIHDYKKTHMVVWQMKEFGVQKSWSQFLKLSYQQLQIERFSFQLLLPMCVSEKGDIVMLVSNGYLEAILYNCRDNTVKRIEIPNGKVWLDAEEYVQSLVLPC